MSKLFQLSHLDGAPLLTTGASEDNGRYLGESIKILDAEPVIVVNLDHLPFVDCIGACLDILYAKQRETAIIVIDPTHTMSIPSRAENATGVTVVGSVAAGAIQAHRLERYHRSKVEHNPQRRGRFRIVRSIA